MSIELMTEAWRADLPTGRKLVLLSLCDNANDQGECYPSIATIARRCGMSERAVQGHLAELAKVGILSREDRIGRSTVFRVHPRRICTPAESAPPQNLHPSPAESAPPPAESAPPTPAESAPITIIEPSLNPKRKQGSAQKRAELAGQIFKIDDVDPEVLQDFTALRKAHKAPLTATAVRDMRGEAAKAGLTLEAVMRVCCARGWRGFEAAWLADKGGGAGQARGAAHAAETPYQRSMRERVAELSPSVARAAPDAAVVGGNVIDVAARVLPAEVGGSMEALQ